MKRAIGAGIILAIATSGCHSIQRTIDKATGGPMRMNNEEAAARYLDISCSYNQKADKINEENEKLSKLYEQGKLSEKVYLRKVDNLELELAKADEKSMKERTDPKYEWPKTVQQLTVEMAAAELENISQRREYQRMGGFSKTVVEDGKWPDPDPFEASMNKFSEKASAIRSALRIPARGEGCKAGKRALTLEQIKKLQNT
jgi:hypothetical protein